MKLRKPVYASLRTLGHTNSRYIDDSLLMGDSKEECESNVSDLGFIIHEKMSVLVPTKSITFLGKNIVSFIYSRN